MHVHPYAGAPCEACLNSQIDSDQKALCLSTVMVPAQLLLLVEELALLSEKQENLVRHLREIPEGNYLRRM